MEATSPTSPARSCRGFSGRNRRRARVAFVVGMGCLSSSRLRVSYGHLCRLSRRLVVDWHAIVCHIQYYLTRATRRYSHSTTTNNSWAHNTAFPLQKRRPSYPTMGETENYFGRPLHRYYHKTDASTISILNNSTCKHWFWGVPDFSVWPSQSLLYAQLPYTIVFDTTLWGCSSSNNKNGMRYLATYSSMATSSSSSTKDSSPC